MRILCGKKADSARFSQFEAENADFVQKNRKNCTIFARQHLNGNQYRSNVRKTGNRRNLVVTSRMLYAGAQTNQTKR